MITKVNMRSSLAHLCDPGRCSLRLYHPTPLLSGFGLDLTNGKPIQEVGKSKQLPSFPVWWPSPGTLTSPKTPSPSGQWVERLLLARQLPYWFPQILPSLNTLHPPLLSIPSLLHWDPDQSTLAQYRALDKHSINRSQYHPSKTLFWICAIS